MPLIPSNVWLVHPVRKDLSALSTWGTIRYTANIGYIYADAITPQGELPPGFIANIQKAVEGFRVDTDFLVMVGDHFQLAVFTAKLIHAYGEFRALRFDKEADGYVEAWITP